MRSSHAVNAGKSNSQFNTRRKDGPRPNRAVAISLAVTSIAGLFGRSHVAKADPVNQIATWSGGAGNGSWSNASNWSPTVVPVNNASNIYNVIVPSGVNITYDQPVPTTINGISYGSGGSLTFGAGEQLTVSNVAALNSNITASGANTLFSAAGVGVSVGNDVLISAAAGATVAVDPVSYTFDSSVTATAWSADGANSSISAPALATITNISQDQNNVRPAFSATNGGVIDFSGLKSLVGGYGPGNYSSYSANTFVVGLGSSINLAGLTTMTRYNNFNIQSANYSFPSLQTAGGLALTLSAGTIVTAPVASSIAGWSSSFSIPNAAVFSAPSLTTLNDSTISIAVGGTMSVPQLQVMQDSSITLQPGETFNYKAPINFDNSRAYVSGGSSFTIAAASYNININMSGTTWSADGSGSVINAASVKTITNISADQENVRPSWSATNGGVIDLSGVRSLIGGYGYGNYNSYSANSFLIGPNSNINFASLTSITQYNNFTVQSANYSFPSLQTAGGLSLTLAVGTTVNAPALTTMAGWSSTFNIANFAAFNAPALTTLNDTTINLSVGGAMSVPNLMIMQDSAIALQPGATFNYTPPVNFDNSRVSVTGGSTFAIAASSYSYNRNAVETAWSASGSNSIINASSVQLLANSDGNLEASASPTFSTTNGGVIDLSGLQTLIGGYGTGYYNSVAFNTFTATSGGAIRFGNVTVSGYNNFSADGATATLDFKSLSLGAQSTMTATNLANLVFHGSFSFTTTNASNLNLDQGVVTFASDGRPTLEVAGADRGTATNGLGNFGVQQLEIGTSNQRTVLELVDKFHNTSGNPALYMLNVSGTGLRIEDGSTLVLNGLNAYTLVNNQFINLNSLFTNGQTLVAYDGGFIAKTMTNIPGGWKTDGNGNWSTAANWNLSVPTSPGDVAYFGPVITAPRTVTLDAAESAGYVGFEGSQEYTIAGTSTLTISGSSGGNIEVVSGVHQITAPVYLAGDTQVSVDNANDGLRLSNAASAANATITKIGAGTLTINPVGAATNLTINTGVVNMIASPVGSAGSFNTVTVASGAAWGLVSYNQTITTLAGSGAIDVGFGRLTVAPGAAGSSFSGTITGSAGVENAGLTVAGIVNANVPGSGVLTLSGSTNYQGDTNIISGGLAYGAGNIAANLSAFTVASGAFLNLNNNSESIGSLAGAGSLQLGTATLTMGGNNASTTFSGPITGTGGLTLNGTGSLTLGASSTFTGQTTINSGSMILANPLALQNSTVQVNINNGLNENSLAATVGAISGGGALNLSGPTLTTGGNNASTTYSGVISGIGQLVKVGSGTLALRNSNSYTGGTTINAGTLDIDSDNRLGAANSPVNLSGGTLYWDSGSIWNDSRPISVANNSQGTLLTYSATLNINAPITGGGTFVKAGSGAIVLSTANTVGGMNIEQGGVEFAANGSAGAGTVAVTNIPGGAAVVLSKTMGIRSTVLTNPVRLDPGATSITMRVDAPYTLALNGPLSGSADFSTGGGGSSGTNVGTGTLALAGGNSAYTGTITVAAGTLSVQSPTALGSAAGGTRVSPGATLNFAGPLNYAVAEPLSVAGTVTATGGATVFPATLNLAGPAVVNVDGSSSLSVTGLAGAFSLTTTGAGSLIVGSTSTLSGLNIAGGSTVQLTGGGSGHRSMLYVSSLASSGTLDLTGNDLDVQGGSLSAITALAQSGYAGGAWNGSGISSSTAAGDSAHLTAIGVILNTTAGNAPLYTSLDGSSVNLNDVLAKETYYGDANLSGQVDGSDYSLIDNGYLSHLTGWYNGDFNYDGVVDGSDYTLIDNAFNMQGAAMMAQTAEATAEAAPAGSTAVPEPVGIAGLGAALSLLCRRRAKRQ